MKLALVINIDAHAVGTLARLFKLAAPTNWDVRIISSYHFWHNPSWFREQVSQCDIVHWMNHKVYDFSREYHARAGNVVSLHHLEGDEPGELFDRLKQVDHVVLHADRYVRKVQEAIGPSTPISQVNYPVAAAFSLTPHPQKPQAAQRRSPSRIGFFAHATYENKRKGVDVLPALARELESRGLNVCFVLSGLGWHETLRHPEFSGFPCEWRVFPSYFDMPKEYAALDCYLCLSRIEGGPMTVLESAAAGIPVVSTAVGRVGEVFDADAEYWRIDPDDVTGAADAIDSILRGGADEVERRIRNASKRVATDFSQSGFVARMAAIYAGVAEGTGLGREVSTLPTTCSSQFVIRKWRAADRAYWAKELLVAGQRSRALRMMLDAFLIDPFCAGIWRIPARKIGLMCDER